MAVFDRARLFRDDRIIAIETRPVRGSDRSLSLPHGVGVVSSVFRISLETSGDTSMDCRRGGKALPLRDYIAGPENALLGFAASSLHATAIGGTQYNPIYLYGTPGIGKSTLAQALSATWRNAHPHQPLVMTSGKDLVRNYSRSVSQGNVRDWLTSFAGASMLVIDDVDHVGGRPGSQNILVQILDEFLSTDRPVLATGSLHPAGDASLCPRLAGRLSRGLTIRIQPPGMDAKCEILRQLAANRGIRCTANAAQYAAKHVAGSVDELNRLLQTVLSSGNRSPSAIAESDVRRGLAHLEKQDKLVSPESMIRSVARYYRIPVAQLTGSSRRQSLVTGRSVAIYLIRKRTGFSFKRIGAYFGHRDHSTVLHAYRKAESLLEHDPATRQAVTGLLRSCSDS